MKEVVIVNQSAGHITRDVAVSFSKVFESTVVITGATAQVDDICVGKTKIEKIISYKRQNVIVRLVTWLFGALQILFLIKFRYNNSYLFLTSNPPFAPLVPLLCNNRFSILIYDVYPDILVQHKIFKTDAVLVKLWQKANKAVFGRADSVFVLSRGMKRVVSEYGNRDKVRVVPLWYNSKAIRPISKTENTFIARHGLTDKFVVLYSGNLGVTHNVDVVLDLALKTRRPEILFIIIGDGDRKKHIQKQIKVKSITNCMVLDYQPIETLSHSLSAADLALVTLGKEASLLSVPSKTFNLMAVGVPILAVAERESELASVVRTHKLGKCYSEDQVEEMVAFIQELADNETYQDELKRRCRETTRLFSPRNADDFVKYCR
jgi:glycosyltransferase involved in cell wall biosynthesis